MERRVRLTFLRVSKGLGLFALSRRLTRSGLRILCYHGFAVEDEADFRPGLFIRSDTFRRRLSYLRDMNNPVLDLETALSALDAGSLPDYATVITIDDGFSNTSRVAFPVLRAFDFPVTVYVTTYYAVKERPIFRLVVAYLFWKTRADRLETSEIGLGIAGTVDLTDATARDALIANVVLHGETRLTENERADLCARLGRVLDVSFADIEANRILTLMTLGEIARASSEGVDIQLHTHRHRLSGDNVAVTREIVENRDVLEPIVGRPLRHLCYPSGVWSADLWPVLRNAGVASATTCEPGLNYRDTPRLALSRFLDGEDVAQIEFEAELSGFTELWRKARTAWRRLQTRPAGVRSAPVSVD